MLWLPPSHSFSLNVHNNTSAKSKKIIIIKVKKKSELRMRGSWQWESDRKERMTDFNKVQQGRKDCRSFLFFPTSFFTTSGYLNTFTPCPFICVCIRWQRNSRTQRETLIPFLFECWPRMATICANCLTLWLSCISSHKYQTGLRSSDNPHMAICPPRSDLPLFRLRSLFS